MEGEGYDDELCTELLIHVWKPAEDTTSGRGGGRSSVGTRKFTAAMPSVSMVFAAHDKPQQVVVCRNIFSNIQNR